MRRLLDAWAGVPAYVRNRQALEVAGTGQLVVAYQAEPGSPSAARPALLTA